MAPDALEKRFIRVINTFIIESLKALIYQTSHLIIQKSMKTKQTWTPASKQASKSFFQENLNPNLKYIVRCFHKPNHKS